MDKTKPAKDETLDAPARKVNATPPGPKGLPEDFHPEPSKQELMGVGGPVPKRGRERTAGFQHKVTKAAGRIRESEYLRHKVDFAMKGYELVEDFV